LARALGGPRQLVGSSAGEGWPTHGVYLFFKEGEIRRDVGWFERNAIGLLSVLSGGRERPGSAQAKTGLGFGRRLRRLLPRSPGMSNMSTRATTPLNTAADILANDAAEQASAGLPVETIWTIDLASAKPRPTSFGKW